MKRTELTNFILKNIDPALGNFVKSYESIVDLLDQYQQQVKQSLDNKDITQDDYNSYMNIAKNTLKMLEQIQPAIEQWSKSGYEELENVKE